MDSFNLKHNGMFYSDRHNGLFYHERHTPIILLISACLAVVEEMEYEIGKIDPRKTIQVGSFRVDSRGNQDLREVILNQIKIYALADDHYFKQRIIFKVSLLEIMYLYLYIYITF